MQMWPADSWDTLDIVRYVPLPITTLVSMIIHPSAAQSMFGQTGRLVYTFEVIVGITVNEAYQYKR